MDRLEARVVIHKHKRDGSVVRRVGGDRHSLPRRRHSRQIGLARERAVRRRGVKAGSEVWTPPRVAVDACSVWRHQAT
eukprot:6212630-Pleurochrysis_carterae.AAC.2